MICGVRGKIENIGMGVVVVDVEGVFYRVFIPKRLAKKLVVGEERKLETYMHVVEDGMSLYGFESGEEVDTFRMLVGVSGVGPKSAVLIFDENEVGAVRAAVINADVSFFEKVKGLGKKTAQKIIIELKSKIGSLKELDLAAANEVDNEDEVYLSLVQLGFDKKQVAEVMKKIPKELGSTEDRLGWCLKNM